MNQLRPATLAVFAVVLASYMWTLVPTVPGGDAGELAIVAQAGAVAHPPGYPLYTMLGWLFARIPAGSVARRVALLSAVAAAGAAALVFATTVRAARLLMAAPRDAGAAGAIPFAAGIVAAGLFAWSPLVWTYAVGAEVFTLHLFFVALLSFLALRWHETHDPHVATWIAFATGLGLAHHHTLVLHAAPLALWLLWTGRGVLWTPRRLATLAVAGLAGLLPYAYLWLAGLRGHPLSWGDTATLQGFLDHLLRRDYGSFQLIPDAGAGSPLPQKIAAWAAHIARATLGAGALLAVVAVAEAVRAALVLPRKRRANSPAPWILLLAACAATHLVVFHWRANVPLEDPLLVAVLARFWMQADVVVCVLAGVGFAIVFAAMESAAAGRTENAALNKTANPLASRDSTSRSNASRAVPAAALAVAFVLVGLRAGLAAPERLRGAEAVVERYGRALLEPLPPRTLLVTSGDVVTNAVRYLQAAEGLRPDVLVVDQELLTKRWYARHLRAAQPSLRLPGDFYHPREAGGFSMRAFLDANAEGRPVYLYPEWKSGDASVAGAWRAWPEGLAQRVLPHAAPPPLDGWKEASDRALADLDARGWLPLDAEQPGTWERVVLEDVWAARHRRAVFLLNEAVARGNDRALLEASLADFDAAARSRPDVPWYVDKNVGIVLGRLAEGAPPADAARLHARQAEAWRRYLAAAPANDPQRDAVAQILAQVEAQLEATRRATPAGTPAN